jgi:SET and MYND domain-containing protein
MVMDGPRVSLRAMKPINKDEQLYISYINTSDPYTRRQQQLKESWFFTCACTKCTRGPVSDQDGWKIEPGALSPKWKRIADHILMKKKRVTEAAIDDEQRVALLEEGAFELYDAACSSASHDERLELIHKGMQFCEQSGLWPVYRQPYAALRHELNIELSTAGQLEEAWKHYSIRYWHIFPKLYTKKINPNRVVELIFGMQLVMELWERRVDLGVDMRLIGISLAQEAKMSVVLSHGEDNTFTKLVQHHYDVVRTVYDQQGHDPSMTVRRLEQERAKWQETTRKFLGAS